MVHVGAPDKCLKDVELLEGGVPIAAEPEIDVAAEVDNGNGVNWVVKVRRGLANDLPDGIWGKDRNLARIKELVLGIILNFDN